MKRYRLRYQVIDAGEEHDIVMDSKDIEFEAENDKAAISKTCTYLFVEYRVANTILEEIISRRVNW